MLLPDELMIGTPTCTAQLVAASEKTGGSVRRRRSRCRASRPRATALLRSRAEKDGLAEITGLVEKPKPEEAPSNSALIGRYVLEPEVFDHLDQHETGAGGEIQLTDALARMIGGKPFHAMRYTGGRYDCGDRLGFLEANVAVALGRAGHARDGNAGASRRAC